MSTKPLGETFPFELAAAGFTRPLVWNAAGDIINAADLTSGERAQLQVIIDAHDPTKLQPPEKRDVEHLLDALIAEGIVPASLRGAIKGRLPGLPPRPPLPVLPTVAPF